LELELFEGMTEGFIIRKSDAPASAKAIEKIVAFVHEHIR
jgi:hypothetical protein